tara:strand:+ start:110 stop:514 length:405 start_codon:yes stop_codon:yes gene_type:complete
MSEIIEIEEVNTITETKQQSKIPKIVSNILFGITIIYGIFSFIGTVKSILYFFSNISTGGAIFVAVVAGIPLLMIAFFIAAIPYYTLNWGIEWGEQNSSQVKKYFIIFFAFISGFILNLLASIIFGFLLALFAD